MPASLAEMLQQVEVTERPATERSALFNVVAVVAVGAALLFGIGHVLVGTGALTELSGAPAEVTSIADAP